MERYLKKLSLAVCIMVALATMLGLQPKVAWAADTNSWTPNGGCNEPLYPDGGPEIVCCDQIGNAEVLIIEDDYPWGYCTKLCNYIYNDSNFPVYGGAVEEAASQLGKSFCRVSSQYFTTMSLTELLKYKIIVIPSDQPSTYYTRISSKIGVLKAAVERGIQLIVHLTEGPDNRGNINGQQILPGTPHGDNAGYYAFGLGHGLNSIRIDLPDSCYVDGETNALLSGWDFSAHGYFSDDPSDLPAGTEIILTANDTGYKGYPVMIHYKLGSGQVLATTMTVEYAFADFEGRRINETLLTNELMCAQLKKECCCCEEKLDILLAAIAEVKREVSNIEITVNDISTKTADISNIKTTVNSINTTVNNIQTTTNTTQTTVNNIQTNTSNIQAKVNDISAQTSNIDDLQAAVTAIEAKLDKHHWPLWEWNPPNLPWRRQNQK